MQSRHAVLPVPSADRVLGAMRARIAIIKPDASGHLHDARGFCRYNLFRRSKSGGTSSGRDSARQRGRVFAGQRDLFIRRGLSMINNRGFSIMEVLVAYGIVAVFVLAVLSFKSLREANFTLVRNTVTKDRLLTSV